MRWRSTMLMLLGAVVAFAAAWATRGLDAGEGRALGPQRVFSQEDGLAVQDIDGVSIIRHGSAPHYYQRTGEGWRQTEPFDVAVDGMAVRQLIVAAADLAWSRRFAIADFDEGTSLATLGLDPPLATVSFTLGERNESFDLGQRTVAGRAWIRRVGSEEVLVVEDALHDRGLDSDLRSWRRRQLFTGESPVNAIEFQNGSVMTTLVRDGVRWAVTSPIQTRADGETMRRFLGVLGRVAHDGFVIDTAERQSFGLDEPAAIISLSRSEGTERLLIGGPAGLASRDRYAAIEGVPSVVRLGETTLHALLPEVISLIEPTASGAREADVKSIEIVAPGKGSVLLERDLEKWRIERRLASGEESKGTAPVEMVEGLLGVLCSTRAPDVVVQKFPTDLARATVTFRGYDGTPLDTVRVAREGEDGRWALENGDGVLRIFPASTPMPIDPGVWPVN